MSCCQRQIGAFFISTFLQSLSMLAWQILTESSLQLIQFSFIACAIICFLLGYVMGSNPSGIKIRIGKNPK